MSIEKDNTKPRRIFSLTTVVILIFGALMIGISIQIPNAEAGSVNHSVGNVDILWLTDDGRICTPISWSKPQTASDPSSGIGLIGLVIDQDNYVHTSGLENIADPYTPPPPYTFQDDFTPLGISMVIDDGTTQKSVGSFQNIGPGTGDPNDILVEQTVWTVANMDWAIFQWKLNNLKASDLTGVCIGLEVPLSKEGTGFGVGGSSSDGGDDIDGFDLVEGVYWASDVFGSGAGTTIGFGSAIALEPITHYYAEDYHAPYQNSSNPSDPDPKYHRNFYVNETWLYNRLHALNSTATDGITPGNITASVGWNDFTIPTGSSRTFTLVMAINSTFDNMIAAIQDARNYFQYVATGFRISEFSDSSSGSPQIEIYNFGSGTTDLPASGFFLSVDGGASPLTGSWSNNPLPTNEHSVFTVTGGIIGPESGKIGLYQDIGGNIALADMVAFGQEGVAPDPLSGESVERRYDSGSASYTNFWLRNASTGPTFGAQNDVGIVVTSPTLVLNDVMFIPLDPLEGYVELMYTGSTSMDISGYKIVCDDEFIIPSGTILNSVNRYYILTYSDYPTFFTNMDASGDNIYLYQNNGDLLDMVGWNSPHSPRMSVHRIPDGNGTHQGYNDATSEAAGWVFNTPLEVLMTEISDSDSTVVQIEVYNPRYLTIDFSSGFSIESESGTLGGTWVVPMADTGNYALFEVSTPSGMDPERDTLRFLQNGMQIEEISYGQKGIVPDPLKDESVERIMVSGNYTNKWCRNLTSGPTFGSQNDVPAISSSPRVVLNEVMFNPGLPQHGFVELIYTDVGSLDIQGYSIICDSEYKITSSNVLNASEPYFILSQPQNPNFFSQMDSFGDNIYLYDNIGQLLDMVGWSSPHNVNKSVVRIPEGFGGHQGYDDTTTPLEGWVFDQNPTVPLVNIGPDQFQIGVPGMTISFVLSVTNRNNVDDVIDITYSSIKGWSVQLLQADGLTPLTDTETGPAQDGIPDTGIVGPYSLVQIVVNVSIPFGIPGGVSEYTTILATSTANPMATESALLNSSTLMGLEYRSPNRYVTFVRGTLMVIGHVDNTFIKITDLSNGNQIAQFTINEGQSWTTNLNDAHVDVNATHNATVLSGNSLYTSGANSWMSYIPTDGGQKYGTLFYGFVPQEMFLFAPRLNPLPPTSISITDISDGDDTTALTNANADFANSDVEIYRMTGFDDDIVKIQSNVQISVLTGKVSNGVDWTATPPSVNGSELGKHFFLFASSDLTILPIENNTTVNIIDLSDGDDSRTQVMNRFDVLTQRSVSPWGGNPIVTRPGITLYHNSNNLIDDDYIEIIADKDVLVYIGPISDQREEFADLSPSVSTGIFSQEVFTYAQNGGANDLQVFVYDKNHTVVKITSLTYSWAPGSGRDSFFDFILDSDDLMGTGPWWWEWGGWGGNLLHIQSNLPISVFNGDFDGASFGSFLSVINPPENLKYPDIVISQADISFDPGSVITKGAIVKINATIHNFGDVNVTGIKVSFYNGDPSLEGILIDSNVTIPFLDVGENNTVSITWLPPSSGIY
ncbi:MAG: hypothetical protein JSV09_04030, partial [Thermoplasmata archaeon]